MPVKIDMSSIEFSAISQMAKDYEILYEALEDISKMVALNYAPGDILFVANYALDRVTIKPGGE